jgi:maltose O-acetyltransferase
MHDAYVVAVNGLLQVPVHRFREWAFRNLAGNALGSGATLERSIRLTTKGGVTVGDGTIVNRGATLDGRGLLRVGAHVNISPEVMLLTSDHDPHSPAFEDRKRSTVIGDRAWISSRAMVLPGAQVGEGAVVAADAQAALPSPYRRLFH